MGQVLLFAVGGGILSGMLFLSAAFGSPGALVTTYLTQLPLFLVGLSLGATAGIVAGAVGAVGTALILGPAAMAAFAAGFAVPVSLLVHQAMAARTDGEGATSWPPPGTLLLWLVGYAAAAVTAAGIVAAMTGDGLRPVIEIFLAGNTALIAGLTGGDPVALAQRLSLFAPAMLAGGWVLMTVANAALAQWLVHRFGLARRPAVAMADIGLPGWPVAVLAGLVAVAYLDDGQIGYLALNLAIVLGLAFFFAGLGVVHALLRGRSARPLLLAVLYGLVFLQGWTALLITGLGVIEQWAGIRRRAAATGPDLEDR